MLPLIACLGSLIYAVGAASAYLGLLACFSDSNPDADHWQAAADQMGLDPEAICAAAAIYWPRTLAILLRSRR